MKRRTGNFIAFDVEEPGIASRTVHHEHFHECAARHLPPMPTWMHDGLAEFYETFRSSANEFEIGHPVQHHVDVLRIEMMPLSELFRAGSKLPDHRQGEKVARFHARSWLLVHYILTARDGGRADLDEWLGHLARGHEPESSFVEPFDVPR